MKNIINTFSVSIVIAMLVMGPSFALAQETTGGGSTAATVSSPDTTGGGSTASTVSASPAPATTGGGSTASTVSASPDPVTTGGGSTADTVSSPDTTGGGSTASTVSASPAPVTTGGGSTASTVTSPASTGGGSTASTISSPSATGGGSTAATVTAPATPATPANTGGGGGGAGGYSGGSGSILPLLVNISDCNYLTSYLKIGRANPVIEVTKLQNFLKNNETMNIGVTGIFDETTFDAVSAFQVKYTADVLTPWGIKNPTGYVYYTTSKKINELYCKKNFALTPAQIAEIEAYRTGVFHGTAEAVTGDIGLAKPDASTSTTSTTTIAKTSPKATTTDSTQVGAVAKTSLATKIWNFIKRLFGR